MRRSETTDRSRPRGPSVSSEARPAEVGARRSLFRVSGAGCDCGFMGLIGARFDAPLETFPLATFVFFLGVLE
jgi:hypothetical protein